VLEKGRIAERGSHRQLLEKSGIYAGLYRQFAMSGIAGEEDAPADAPPSAPAPPLSGTG